MARFAPSDGLTPHAATRYHVLDAQARDTYVAREVFMHRALTIVVLSVFVLACTTAAAKTPNKKVRWTPIPHQDFRMEAELGALLTCTYKVVDAGQRFEHIDEESGLKVQVIKPAGGDLKFTLYWNHKRPRKEINDERAAAALQGAVDACFEKLYGDDVPDEG